MIHSWGHSKDISPSIDINLRSIEPNNTNGRLRETIHNSMHGFLFVLTCAQFPKPMREYSVWCSELQLMTSNGTEPRSAIHVIWKQCLYFGYQKRARNEPQRLWFMFRWSKKRIIESLLQFSGSLVGSTQTPYTIRSCNKLNKTLAGNEKWKIPPNPILFPQAQVRIWGKGRKQ